MRGFLLRRHRYEGETRYRDDPTRDERSDESGHDCRLSQLLEATGLSGPPDTAVSKGPAISGSPANPAKRPDIPSAVATPSGESRPAAVENSPPGRPWRRGDHGRGEVAGAAFLDAIGTAQMVLYPSSEQLDGMPLLPSIHRLAAPLQRLRPLVTGTAFVVILLGGTGEIVSGANAAGARAGSISCTPRFQPR